MSFPSIYLLAAIYTSIYAYKVYDLGTLTVKS